MKWILCAYITHLEMIELISFSMFIQGNGVLQKITTLQTS